MTTQLINAKQAETFAKIQFAAFKKVQDVQKQNGFNVLKLLNGATQNMKAANGRVDVYA